MAEPAETRSLVMEREMPQPPEKVWRALTQAPLIEDWLMRNDFHPVVGHRFQFRSEPVAHWDGVIEAEVLAVEPYERLAYSWNSMGLESTVTWTLTPTAGGVLVRMEQSGFRPDQDRNYQGAAYGWRGFMDRLDQVVINLG